MDPPSLLWRKAAALGSLWASAEIVLGSFLHNARIPFGGHLLTALGIMLMTGGRRLWPEPGLLWRSALVCAAMKSISPSAFIIGPMLAISIEGFLMEAALRVLGEGAVGCLTGGVIAMIWTFLQPFLRQFLFYGPDAALLYAQGWRQIAQWSGFAGASLWTPALSLLAANAVLGAAAAAAGMRLGRWERENGEPRKETKPSALPPPVGGSPAPASRFPSPEQGGRPPFLTILHVALVILAMAATQRLPMPWLLLGTGLYTGWGLSRQTLVFKRLRRPGLWAGIVGAALLAGLILGKPSLGLRMGLRALLLTVGFACVSEELRHSALIGLLERHGGALFIDTVRRAFRTFPGLLSSLPTGREMARRPMNSLRRMLAQAPALLDDLDR
jgi:hypothetical protein